MKVFQIIARMNIGGPALHLCQLNSGLEEHYGHRVSLLHGRVAEGEGSMMGEAKKRKLVSIYIPEMSREISLKDDFLSFMKIFWIVWKQRPAVLHTHTAKAGMIGRVAAGFLSDIKIIHTYHGTVFHGYGYSRFKTSFFLFVERMLAQITDKIVVLSKTLKKEMLELDIAKELKFVTIPLGFDFSPFSRKDIDQSQAIRSSVKLPNPTIIGFIGRFEFVKQPNFVVHLAEHAKLTGKSYHFVMVGDGTLMANLKHEVSEKKLSDYVTFLGWKEDVSPLYAQFDILMMCSNNEGTPVVLIEAMASGCPVVSNNVGGIGDVLAGEKGGYLTGAFTVEAYFENFEKVMKNRELLSSQAREHVESIYGLPGMLNRYHVLYELVAEHSIVRV